LSIPAKPLDRLRLTTMTVVALSTSRIGMPLIAEFASRASGLTTSLAPSDQRDVGAGEVGVDVLEVVELVVRHVGFGEQHVHVPWHAAGHRVDRVAHVDVAVLEQIGELARHVLRLCDRESVARHDDHPLGEGERDRDVLGAGAAGDLVVSQVVATGRLATEGGEQHVRQRAVHRLDHDVGEDQTPTPRRGRPR
jgi:hypothetical protein